MTEKEYNVAIQNHRYLYSKFQLLNFNYQVIGTFDGVVVGNPSFTNDSNSVIRRTCSVQVEQINSDFDIKQNGKLWLDKLIKIYVGIKDETTDEIVYTNMGIYLINNPNHVYSISENTLTINGIDLMAKLTGMRTGNLEGMEYQVPAGSNVRNVIINTIKLGGFTKYVCEECTTDVPNNMSISIGGSLYNIISAMLDVMPNYQVYFDVDGIFHYNTIPNGVNEQTMVDDKVWNKTLINYNQDYDYENIKNEIVVLGKAWDDVVGYSVSLDTDNEYKIITDNDMTDSFYLGVTMPNSSISSYNSAILNVYNSYGSKTASGSIIDLKNNIKPNSYNILRCSPTENYFACNKSSQSSYSNASLSGDTYYITNLSITELVYGTTFFIKTPSIVYNGYVQYLKVNNFEKLKIYSSTLEPNSVYEIITKINYDETLMTVRPVFFEYISSYQPKATVQETNPQSPFYVNGSVGKLRIVLNGGDYDNIYSDDLAKQRANFELYQRCRLQDSITITTVPIYWLDTNWVIEITLPNKQGIEETNKYIIKSINTTLGTSGTQSITMMKYYPYYPSV